MKWKDEYNKWKFKHDFSVYKTRSDIDEVIVSKMAELLDEQEKIISNLQTIHNSEYIPCSCLAGCEMCEDKRKKMHGIYSQNVIKNKERKWQMTLTA